MKFCTTHWTALRKAIDERGMAALVAESGEQAASNMAADMAEGSTVNSFDPLMGAHNAIFARAMAEIESKYQQNPLMLMADENEHPEWACPICALNWCHKEHERVCTKPDCDYPKRFTWDDEIINGAADFMVSEWKRMKP